MASYEYATLRELQGRHFEFKARLRNLESGLMTDEDGKEYPDPEGQANWFREEIKKIEDELEGRRWL